MTHLLLDILRQPDELQGVLDYLWGQGRPTLDAAAQAVRRGRHVYVTGIGSSWHAALNAASLFRSEGVPINAWDAAELLHFDDIPRDSVVIMISRSGRSVEVVNLLAKALQSRATVIGLTNSENGQLAQKARIPIVVPTNFDHAVSVNTYSTVSAAASILACAVIGSLNASLVATLSRAIRNTAKALAGWQKQIADASWLAPGSIHYFLARGSSLGSCHEARLLWEEVIKAPATALGTSSFRHGSQEVVAKDMRFGMWIDGKIMRNEDLAVARDLGRLGASVMLVGQDLPDRGGDLVFQLPKIPSKWQFLIDIIPVQLAAERLARLSGSDCDSFRLCSYIVEGESGLLRDNAGIAKDTP